MEGGGRREDLHHLVHQMRGEECVEVQPEGGEVKGCLCFGSFSSDAETSIYPGDNVW